MINLLDHPFLVFLVSFVVMGLAYLLGLWVRSRLARAGHARSEDMEVIGGAVLSLLALIIGFTFSMAAGRYDQRRNLEAEEANAIGAEYHRAGLLPAADAAHVRTLLVVWLDDRIAFFNSGDGGELTRVNQRTDALEDQLWSAVQTPAIAQPTAVASLVAAGMNEVIDSRGLSQAAIWNRIPTAAWVLMVAIAICSNALLGYGSKDTKLWRSLSLFVPLSTSISFLLIADIDSPRHGLILVPAENLANLAVTLKRSPVATD
jgi:hypothetical protein